MSVDTHPTTSRPDAVVPVTPHVRAGGPRHRRVPGRRSRAAPCVLTLVVFAGGTESVITGSLLVGFGFGWALIAALTSRYTNRPQRWALVPATAMGGDRPRAAGLHPRERRHDPAELGVAAGRAGAGRVDVRPDAPHAPPSRPLAAHPRRRRPGPRIGRRHVREHRPRPGPGHLPRPREDLRRRRAPAAPGLPRPRRSHRRALQRPRRDLRLLGPDLRPGGRDHPGVRLRPGRTGLERRRGPPPGRGRGRRGPAHPAGRSRRDRPLRPGRALHRWHLRPDLRRPLPRAGRRAWCSWTAPAPNSSPGSPPTPASTR